MKKFNVLDFGKMRKYGQINARFTFYYNDKMMKT